MVFNSFKFVIFFAVCLLLYFLLPQRFRKYLLLVSSYFFYMSWKPEYGGLLLLSTLLQYFCSLQIDKFRLSAPSLAKRWMWAGVGSDLSMLFFFKYFDFAGENVSWFANLLGWQLNWTSLNILLPVGISFYVFQTMSYTIDVYRGTMRAEKDFLWFALYVSFFPQLVAGPIERASTLLPQLKAEPNSSFERISSGGKLMLIGFLKKMVVADNLAPFVDRVYDPLYDGTGLEYILATWGFMFQVYGDFSGYSDIAVGSARIMGYDLMTNFRQPFFATYVAEFWNRWHISLSTWVKDYLYIPLGGNRKGEVRTYFNLFLSMFIIGIWHGAKWTVVIYAVINGISVALSRFWQKNPLPFTILPQNVIGRMWHRFVTFNIICLPHVFFRSHHVEQAVAIFKKIGIDFLSGNILSIPPSLPVIGSFFLIWILAEDYRIEKNIQRIISPWWRSFYYSMVVVCVLIFGVFRAAQFIYFQF